MHHRSESSPALERMHAGLVRVHMLSGTLQHLESGLRAPLEPRKEGDYLLWRKQRVSRLLYPAIDCNQPKPPGAFVHLYFSGDVHYKYAFAQCTAQFKLLRSLSLPIDNENNQSLKIL